MSYNHANATTHDKLKPPGATGTKNDQITSEVENAANGMNTAPSLASASSQSTSSLSSAGFGGSSGISRGSSSRGSSRGSSSSSSSSSRGSSRDSSSISSALGGSNILIGLSDKRGKTFNPSFEEDNVKPRDPGLMWFHDRNAGSNNNGDTKDAIGDGNFELF